MNLHLSAAGGILSCITKLMNAAQQNRIQPHKRLSMDVVAIVKCTNLYVCVIGLPLQGLGLYILLTRHFRRPSKQILILISLSASEIVWLVGCALLQCFEIIYHQREVYAKALNVQEYNSLTIPTYARHLYKYIMSVGAIQVNFSLIMLTLERLVSIVLPRRYSVAARNVKLFTKLLFFSWC